MTTSRITTFDAYPETVFGAMLDVADSMMYRSHIIDQRSRQAVISRDGKAYRLSVSVTDNGYGQSSLHVSWTPRGSSGASKCAKKLLKATGLSLREMSAPQIPPPPPL